MMGLDATLRRMAVNRLLAQSHIARLRDGAIAHHAPAAPILLDASADPLANTAALTRAFPRSRIGVHAVKGSANLGFAAFGFDQSALEFSSALAPGGAFAIVATHDMTEMAAALQAAGLRVTARSHFGGFGQSLAGVKPVAGPHEGA